MAERLKISSAAWDKLSDSDKGKVKKIIEAAGLVKGGVDFISDPQGAAADDIFGDIGRELSKPICIAACTAAQGVATAACTGTGPAAPACALAAQLAGDYCRSRC